MCTDTSQVLSQGATETASSLEKITSSMYELGNQTKTNAENASQANQLYLKKLMGNRHLFLNKQLLLMIESLANTRITRSI